jgi:hypothetical protein
MTKNKSILKSFRDSSLICAYGNEIDVVEHKTGGNMKPRRLYQAPELISYGDVRDITMGPTVGFGESGGGPFCSEGDVCP